MIKVVSSSVPVSPGCYIFRDSRKKPLYVGKAKNLRKRVANYFRKNVPGKIKRLRREAAELDFIVTDGEWEAFLLENNLIKQFKPRFNVLLKDDKTYPYIKLTVKDRYPKALFTRTTKKDGSLYFGPFVPGSLARKNLKLLQDYFKVATCKYPLDGSRKRPCLLWEMGRCFAPCVKGNITPAEYAKVVGEAKLFLEGRTGELRAELEQRMKDLADERAYERAAHYRDLLRAIEALGGKQAVAGPGEGRWDFHALYGRDGDFVQHTFIVLDGKVVDRRRRRFSGVVLERGELFSSVLTRLYSDTEALPDNVAVSEEFREAPLVERFLSERRGRRVRVLFPKRGGKALLIRNLLENARLEFEAEVDASVLLKPLSEAIGLEAPPRRIECFDVSHTGGEATMASCVVWEGGRMVPSLYRHFSMKKAAPLDDCAAIAEAVRRRCARLTEEGSPMPDVVLVDGGAGQVNSALAAIAEVLEEPVPVVGIAKREELLYLPGVKAPIALPKDSPALRLLQRIRDEAHRFAVKGHRRRRSGKRFKSPLLEIPGIGPVSARKLLRTFMTTEAVKAAPAGELEKVVGRRAAAAVLAWSRGSGSGAAER